MTEKRECGRNPGPVWCLSSIFPLHFIVNVETVHACAAKFKVDHPIHAPVPLTPSRWITALPRTFSLEIYFCRVFTFHPVKFERPHLLVAQLLNAVPGRTPRQWSIGVLWLKKPGLCLTVKRRGSSTPCPLVPPSRVPFYPMTSCASSALAPWLFSPWPGSITKFSRCTWDFQAPYMCILADDSLDENVKEDESASLPMDLLYV